MPTPETPDPATDDHLARTTRRVNTVTDGGRPARLLVVTRSYDVAADEVWAALTDHDRLAQWWGPVAGDLRTGGHLTMQGGASATVLTCTATEHVSLSWTVEEVEGSLDLSLRPVPGGTVLQVDHRSPVAGRAPDQGPDQGPAAAGIGWELAVAALAGHLSGSGAGAAAPPPPALLEASAAGWAEAAVADGDDPDEAGAAARRAAASYGLPDDPSETQDPTPPRSP